MADLSTVVSGAIGARAAAEADHQQIQPLFESFITGLPLVAAKGILYGESKIMVVPCATKSIVRGQKRLAYERRKTPRYVNSPAGSALRVCHSAFTAIAPAQSLPRAVRNLKKS